MCLAHDAADVCAGCPVAAAACRGGCVGDSNCLLLALRWVQVAEGHRGVVRVARALARYWQFALHCCLGGHRRLPGQEQWRPTGIRVANGGVQVTVLGQWAPPGEVSPKAAADGECGH